MKRFMILTAGFVLLAIVDTYGYSDGNFQIWHTEGQDVSLRDGTKLAFEEEFRYGDDASELYYQHYDVGLSYNVNKNLTTKISYRQIYSGEKGKFKPEFQPNINITPKYEFYGFKIEDNNRFELKLFDDNRTDSVEYRNRLLVKSPWKFPPLKIEPYVSDEVFVNLNSVAWRRNWFSAGITFDLVKNLKGDIYYRLEDAKKSGRWTSANILGLKLNLVF